MYAVLYYNNTILSTTLLQIYITTRRTKQAILERNSCWIPKEKHNVDTTEKEFPIEIYIGEPPYELYFIVLILQREIVIGPTKKLVASYMVRDLALLN